MKRFTSVIAVCAALLFCASTSAFAKVGELIQGTPVGLEHGPPGGEIVARAPTNGDGNVTFNNLKPGHYSFVLTDTSTLKVPCRISVTFGREKLPISERILPGKRGGSAYAVDSTGHKLAVVVDKPGGSITVHLQTDK
jgi:hypothetical protein